MTPSFDQFTLTVPANLSAGPKDLFLEINGATSNTVTLPVAGRNELPFIRSGVNGASFAACKPVAAGTILSLFVSGDIGEEITTGLFPEIESDGLSVTFDGIEAPLFDIVAPRSRSTYLSPPSCQRRAKSRRNSAQKSEKVLPSCSI